MWVTKQLYKQRNKNGDNWLLEKLFVLFIQDWKLRAIFDNNLFWKVENYQGKSGQDRKKLPTLRTDRIAGFGGFRPLASLEKIK